MEPISIRYGETVVLPLDAGDTTAVSADLFIGKPGELYVLTKHISLVDGAGTFTLSTTDTKLPLDTYFYQINVTDALGQLEKYPDAEDGCGGCDSEFPKFIINEALDATEVS
jgi:hypothetical protein